MQKYSVFVAPILSFFHADFYRDVGRNWRGIGLKLLLLLQVVSWLIVGLKLHVGFSRFARDEFPKIVEKFPQIDIKNGVVSSPVPQPYEIRLPKSDHPFVVIDTTGKINSLDDTTAEVLLTKDKVYTRDRNNRQERAYSLADIKSFSVDKTKLTGWMDTFAKSFAFVFIPVAIIAAFIYRILQALLYAAVGLIWNSVFNANLSYAALMRLSFVAITPVIVIDTVFWTVGATLPYWPLICLVIAMVYLLLAVKANEQPKTFLTDGPGGQHYFAALQVPAQQQQPAPPQYPPTNQM